MKNAELFSYLFLFLLFFSCSKEKTKEIDPSDDIYNCIIRLVDESGNDIIIRNKNESDFDAIKVYSLDKNNACVPGIKYTKIYYNYYGIGLATMLSEIDLNKDPDCRLETATVIDWGGKMVKEQMDTLIFRSYNENRFEYPNPWDPEIKPIKINYEILFNNREKMEPVPGPYQIRINGVHPIPDFYKEIIVK